MAQREYRSPVGTDLRDIAGSTWLIGGIEIDNPSGSWLRVTGINQYVPPYTMGWGSPVLPQQTSISVLFTDSPSGSPSQLIGSPIVVRISDTPISTNSGFPSGASEYQQPGKANLKYRFDGFTVTEAGVINAFTISPATGFAFVFLKWRVYASLDNPSRIIRTPVQVHMIDDGPGNAVFPSIVLSQYQLDSGYIPALARQLPANGGITVGGQVAPGGGSVDLVSYMEFYSQFGD